MSLSGPYVMKGYLNDPELSLRTITPEGLRTGDLGYRRTIRGERHYFVSGRIRDLINRSGESSRPARSRRSPPDAPRSGGLRRGGRFRAPLRGRGGSASTLTGDCSPTFPFPRRS